MSNDGVNTGRRRFLTAATTVVGAAGAVGAAVPFVGSWNPSAKAKAAGAPVTADISKIEPGQLLVVEWRGKPVYILRRTPEALAAITEMEGSVKDPLSEEAVQPAYIEGEFRALRDELLVVLGLCTHLGCAPKYHPEVGAHGADWLGGFYCPCHGSKFDLAGRVFKDVPAPTNLEIPPYRFENETIIVIGEDQEAA